FFQAEDGIRYRNVTGVQTCALPILLHVDGELDSDIAVGDFHQDVLKGEATAKVGGSSAFGLNMPLPLAKAEAKGYGIDGKIQADSDIPAIGGFGVGGEANLLKAKAYGGVDEGSVGLSAKAAAAETEGSIYLPVPFTDTDAKFTLEGSAGSIGGEAKVGKETKLYLRVLVGVKLGL